MTTDARSAQKAEKGSRNTTPWLILAILLIFSIAAPLNQFKVPPIIPILMSALGISISGAGLLMSVYAITGLILALPAGIIFQKTGHRVTASWPAAPSYSAPCSARSVRAWAVCSPAVSSKGPGRASWRCWRRPSSRGGSSSEARHRDGHLGDLGAPRHRPDTLDRAHAGAVVRLACDLVVRRRLCPCRNDPLPGLREGGPGGCSRCYRTGANGASGRWRDFRSGDAQPQHLAAGCGFRRLQCGSHRPRHLHAHVPGLAARHVAGTAALIASITTLITIFSAPGGGILSDKIGSRKKPYLVGFAAAIILLPLTGVLNLTGLIILMVVSGLVLGVIPTNIFAAAVEATGDERQGGAAMAVIMVGQNAGMLLGPIIFGHWSRP